MIHKPTVFIVGAGMSTSCGYPDGSGLKEKIIKELKYEHSNVRKAILDLEDGITSSEISDFVKALTKSHDATIDSFLGSNLDIQKLGKLAIKAVILQSFRKGCCEEEVNHPYRQVWEILTCRNLEDFIKNKVTFVTFNYDCSLERYFSEQIKIKFLKKKRQSDKEYQDQIRECVEVVPVLHVHGECELDSCTEPYTAS